jgi:hypothetical protein
MMADDFDDPFDSQDITPAISAEWEARRRVAAAIKSLTEALVTSAPAPALLDELTTRLDAMTATLAAGRRLYGRLAFAAEGSHGNFAQLGHELNALSGLSNPVAPPVHTWIDGDMAHGRYDRRADDALSSAYAAEYRTAAAGPPAAGRGAQDAHGR